MRRSNSDADHTSRLVIRGDRDVRRHPSDAHPGARCCSNKSPMRPGTTSHAARHAASRPTSAQRRATLSVRDADTPPAASLRHRVRNAPRALNHGLKRLALRALAWLVRAPHCQPLPRWREGPHRILYLRYDRIGDMVLATGIIKAIALGQPTLTLDVLASARNAPVLERNPHVAAVHAIDKRRPWSYVTALVGLRQVSYDAVIDTAVMAPSLTTTLLMWASGARYRIGMAGRGNDFALTHPLPRLQGARHYVEHSAALLQAFAVPASGPERGFRILRPEVYLSRRELEDGEARWLAAQAAAAGAVAPSRSLRLLVNVSAGAYWRYWPEAHFIAALRHLRARRPRLCALVLGAPADGARKLRIALGAGVPVANTDTVRQMMATVAACDLVLTADTSVTHIASGFRKPVVALFARGGGDLYGPYATCGRAVATRDASLDSLPPEPVIGALESVLTEEFPAWAADRAPERRSLSPRASPHHTATVTGAAPYPQS